MSQLSFRRRVPTHLSNSIDEEGAGSEGPVSSYGHFRFQFRSLWIASRRFRRIRKRLGFLCSAAVPILAAFLRLRLLSRRGRFLSSHPINGTQLKLILLSYARPANVDLLVRLCCIDSVDRIVVSNNNPRYRVRDIVRVRDPRLVLIDQEDHVKPGIRFVLARDEPSDLYIAIDDDVFLTPSQLRLLVEKLAAEPRSEEHTSELQSHSDLVCRLLLEKKNHQTP